MAPRLPPTMEQPQLPPTMERPRPAIRRPSRWPRGRRSRPPENDGASLLNQAPRAPPGEYAPARKPAPAMASTRNSLPWRPLGSLPRTELRMSAVTLPRSAASAGTRAEMASQTRSLVSVVLWSNSQHLILPPPPPRRNLALPPSEQTWRTPLSFTSVWSILRTWCSSVYECSASGSVWLHAELQERRRATSRLLAKRPVPRSGWSPICRGMPAWVDAAVASA